jgi:2-iminobutanoate/2-iminopropanoate deaminase
MASRLNAILRHMAPVARVSSPATPLRALATSAGRGTLQVVSSPDAPKAIGPYSQGIKANGFLFVSGCLGINPKSGDITGDVVAQTKQAMENMRAVLTAGQSSFPQVVKTTILLADITDFPKVNECYATYFPANPPARATFAVKDLPKGGLVEIEAVAVHN